MGVGVGIGVGAGYIVSDCVWNDIGTATGGVRTVVIIKDCVVLEVNHILWYRLRIKVDSIKCRACRQVVMYRAILREKYVITFELILNITHNYNMYIEWK